MQTEAFFDEAILLFPTFSSFALLFPKRSLVFFHSEEFIQLPSGIQLQQFRIVSDIFIIDVHDGELIGSSLFEYGITIFLLHNIDSDPRFKVRSLVNIFFSQGIPA